MNKWMKVMLSAAALLMTAGVAVTVIRYEIEGGHLPVVICNRCL